MGFYVYKKYYLPQAKNYAEAPEQLMQAEENGVLKDFFVSSWARDEKDMDKSGWMRDIKKQLTGGGK